MSTATRLALIVATVLLIGACADSDDPDEQSATAYFGTDGAALYEQACASCHGADLRGTDAGPPFLDAIYRPGHHADASFFLAVKNGARSHHWDFGNMPPVNGLNDEQIAAIVAFVRAQQRTAGIE